MSPPVPPRAAVAAACIPARSGRRKIGLFSPASIADAESGPFVEARGRGGAPQPAVPELVSASQPVAMPLSFAG